MTGDPTMHKPDAPLTWNAAAPELPEMPMISPGADAMSMTIAGVLPTLAAEMTASVTALSAKENMYSGKLTAADAAYSNSDDQGSQAVGQLTSMLGEVGKMAQSAGGSGGGSGGGGAGGIFSSLMEQAMKAMQGGEGGSHDGDPREANEHDKDNQDPNAQAAAPQVAAGQGAGPQGAPGQPSGGQAPTHAPAHAPAERETRPEAQRHQPPPVDGAGPGEGQRGAGPAPITQPEPAHRREDDDLSRRM